MEMLGGKVVTQNLSDKTTKEWQELEVSSLRL
jgi:hypothetical protein